MKTQDSILLSDITNFLLHGAILREGQNWLLLVGPFKSAQYEKSEEISICCVDFYSPETAYFESPAWSVRLSTTQLKTLIEKFLQEQKLKRMQSASQDSVSAEVSELKNIQWQQPLKSDYQTAFFDIQKRIQQQHIRKAVPVVFERAPLQIKSVHIAQMILNLIEAPQNLYVYGKWHEQGGILGATPETLFELESNHFRTMALAGTSPKNSPERVSLLDDEKELEEHRYVVEGILQELKDLGPIRTTGPQLLELPSLWHLQTKIELDLKQEVDVLNLLKKLHPTPALGVFPRQADYRLMKAYPGQDKRGFFGAPIAFNLGHKMVRALVAIRNVQWTLTEVMIGSGGGVVQASQVEREWQELEYKRRSVKAILGFI